MRQKLKTILARLGFRLLREPPGIVMGHDLWRDLHLLIPDSKSPLCIDAGANRGEMTEAMLKLGRTARVHAFEPSPKCQTLLHARFAGNSRVTVVGSGLGEKADNRTFHQYANDHLGSFLPLEAAANNPFKGEPELTSEKVPLTTLDDYARRQGFTEIDLLKIDTQGFDLRVLQGAAGLFGQGAITLVLIELNFLQLYENQAAPAEIIAYLSQHGLQLVDLYEKCRRDQRLAWCTALFGKVQG